MHALNGNELLYFFSYDIMIDKSLKPWMLESNGWYLCDSPLQFFCLVSVGRARGSQVRDLPLPKHKCQLIFQEI